MHLPEIDILRTLATIAVVVLHSAGPYLYQFDTLPFGDWQIANIHDAAVRMAVPVFFMISGYLLIDREEPPSRFLGKRARKIVIPWLMWVLLYYPFRLLVLRQDMSPTEFLALFLQGRAYYHLWFFHSLLGLYLLIPLLSAIPVARRTRLFVYFSFLWLGATIIVPLVNDRIIPLFFAERFSLNLDIGMFGGFTGYLLLGYLLRQMPVSDRVGASAVLLYLAAALATIIFTSAASQSAGDFDQTYYGYLSLNVMIMAVAFFAGTLWLGRRFPTPPYISSLFRKAGSAAFGIYLVHPMILDSCRQGLFGPVITTFSSAAPSAIALVAAITFLLAWLLVAVLRRLPVLRLLV